MDPIQVLIADDDPGVLEVLTSIVTADPAMDVIGAASGAEEAIDLARDLRPDVALVDVRMPGGGGPRAARGIRRGSPHTAVIALSAIEDPVAVVAMVEAGASGFVSKADTTLEIVRAIRRCREGGTSLSARIRDGAAEALASRLASGTRSAGPRNLSRDRFRNLVDDVGAGFSGLNRVVELRPDFVKLDVALTRGIDSDHLRQSLVAMLGSFARETGAALIAEGLETDTQIAKLLELDVRLGQGFRLGRPGPLPFPDGSGRLRWGGRHAFTPGRTEGRVEETVHVPDVGPRRDGAS
jgi:DNA-binding NarL/FixJ family response regulator